MLQKKNRDVVLASSVYFCSESDVMVTCGSMKWNESIEQFTGMGWKWERKQENAKQTTKTSWRCLYAYNTYYVE